MARISNARCGVVSRHHCRRPPPPAAKSKTPHATECQTNSRRVRYRRTMATQILKGEIHYPPPPLMFQDQVLSPQRSLQTSTLPLPVHSHVHVHSHGHGQGQGKVVGPNRGQIPHQIPCASLKSGGKHRTAKLTNGTNTISCVYIDKNGVTTATWSKDGESTARLLFATCVACTFFSCLLACILYSPAPCRRFVSSSALRRRVSASPTGLRFGPGLGSGAEESLNFRSEV